PRGANREQFVTWAVSDGARQMGFEPILADVDVWRDADGTPAVMLAPSVNDDGADGVNVLGYLRNETGLGGIARGFVGVLRACGVPLGLRDLSELSPNRSGDTSVGRLDGITPYGVNLVCANADQHFVVRSHVGDD